MNLFDYSGKNNTNEPLAYRMRPRSLGEYLGQENLVGPRGPLRKMIEEDHPHSFVLYGPPGSGKTTLALLIAQATRSHFEYIKAVTSGAAELKNLAREAEDRLRYYQQRTVLFVDEVHRFNKAQQDVLLPFVENGLLTLIGATTENPLYEINTALLSRLKVYVLEPLTPDNIKTLLDRAINDPERGLAPGKVELTPEALEEIVSRSKGDARNALNILETAYLTFHQPGSPVLLTEDDIRSAAGHFYLNYDKKDDAHYDTISAFIKSIRGSDPDAALFWLAVMIHGGEDPRFIARRLVIHAAEDIGMADPLALLMATAAFDAVNFVGLPEARIPLAEATIYLATAPKSNTSVMAIDQAMDYVKKLPKIKVPGHIADSSHSKAHTLGKGVGYKYPHSFGGYVKQNYFPEDVAPQQFYRPSEHGREAQVKKFLAMIRRITQPNNTPEE
ncbi:MAG: replication-associated recombination protein A [Solirubrobacterales bacterium]